MKKKIPYRIQYSLKSCKRYITATADIVPRWLARRTFSDGTNNLFYYRPVLKLLYIE